MIFVWVAVAGGLGSVARYGLTRVLPMSALPWGTLAANLLGSFLIAWLYVHSDRVDPTAAGRLRVVLGVGFCGGFTTYSTFNYEMLRLAESAGLSRSLLYLAVTVLGCVVAALLGSALGRMTP